MLLTPNWVLARSLNIDTKGYALGLLSKISRVGTSNRAIVGDILLGRDSGVVLNPGHQSSNFTINQWRFCFEDDRYDTLGNLVGSSVVVEYKTPKNSSLLTCSASNELIEVYRVIKYQALDKTQFVSDSLALHGEISSGVEFGRIIKTKESRQQSKYYFLTLQIGNSGNLFRDLVTDDRELFYFAVECLKMAVKVRVHYIERLPGVSQYGNTRLYVWKIEIID